MKDENFDEINKDNEYVDQDNEYVDQDNEYENNENNENNEYIDQNDDGILDTIKNKFNELADFLNLDGFVLVIIIVLLICLIVGCIIGYIMVKKNTYEKHEFKRKLDEKLEKETGIKNLIRDPKINVVNNKIEKKTKTELNTYNIEKKKFKNKIFIKNINNSIQFCIDNNKFDIAGQIEEFKIIYIKLYNLHNSKNPDKKEIKKYTTDLNTIDKIIQQRLEMN